MDYENFSNKREPTEPLNMSKVNNNDVGNNLEEKKKTIKIIQIHLTKQHFLLQPQIQIRIRIQIQLQY